MNNKAETSQIGVLVALAITVIVGVILLQASAQNIGATLDTVTLANRSIGATVVNGTSYYITDIKSLSSVVVFNQTGDIEIASGNFTVTNNVVYNGQEAVQIVPNTPAQFKSNWKISGVGQPLGYISDGGGRAMSSLVIILMALALAVIVITYSVRKDFF